MAPMCGHVRQIKRCLQVSLTPVLDVRLNVRQTRNLHLYFTYKPTQQNLRRRCCLPILPVRFCSTYNPKNIDFEKASNSSSESSTFVVDLTSNSSKSAVDFTNTASFSQNIPDPPPIPETLDISETAVNVLSELAEPSFASQGLGGWGSVGLIQNCLESIHVTYGVPWWMSIVIGTIVVRTLMFPLVVIAQRNSAKMNNNLPQMQIIQVKMTQARQSGNAMLAAKYAQELMIFMKEKEIKPFKNLLVPLVQAPVFISFFVALRGMANLPIESMKVGGLYWFTDLTIPDPYFLTPLITSATLFLTIELGVEGGIRTDSMQWMRYVLRAMPVIIFPFTINFPAAILCYWMTSNVISLGQVALLRLPPVRQFFKIEKIVRHNPETLPIQRKGFMEGFKDSFTNTKIARELEERSRLNEIQFRKAGTGPIQKTYPYDPTKQLARPASSGSAISTSSKSQSSPIKK